MKIKGFSIILLLLIFVLAISSCKAEEPVATPDNQQSPLQQPVQTPVADSSMGVEEEITATPLLEDKVEAEAPEEPLDTLAMLEAMPESEKVKGIFLINREKNEVVPYYAIYEDGYVHFYDRRNGDEVREAIQTDSEFYGSDEYVFLFTRGNELFVLKKIDSEPESEGTGGFRNENGSVIVWFEGEEDYVLRPSY